MTIRTKPEAYQTQRLLVALVPDVQYVVACDATRCSVLEDETAPAYVRERQHHYHVGWEVETEVRPKPVRPLLEVLEEHMAKVRAQRESLSDRHDRLDREAQEGCA